jgi:hypothetical protein
MTAPAHERYFTVPELIEMTQSKLRGPTLVEEHIGCSFNLAMSRDDDDRQGETLCQNGVNEDESLDRAIHEQARIFFDKVRFAAVASYQIEVPFLNEKLLHSDKYLGRVIVAKFRDEHTHRKGLALA